MFQYHTVRAWASSALALAASFTLVESNLAAAEAAQAGKPAAAEQAPVDALVIHSEGLEKLLVDPKDQGLVRALRLIDDRLLELPGELDEPEMPAGVMQLVLDLFLAPMTLRAGMLEPEDQVPGAPPMYGELAFHAPNARDAEALAGRFAGVLAAAAPMPSQAAPGMPGFRMIDLQGVPLYHGTKTEGATSSFVIALNKTAPAPAGVMSMGLPDDVRPVFFVEFDSKQIQPLLEMGLNQPGAEMFRMQMEGMGLYGADASKITAAVGHGKDRSHSWVRYSNYKKLLQSMGALAETGLTTADLKRIPADATVAQVTKMNPGAITQMIEMIRQQAAQSGAPVPEDPMAMVEQHLGVHPQRDVLDHIGDTMGAYMSDTTGGGGLFSLVVFTKIKNADALSQSIARLSAHLNELARQHARGYVRIAQKHMDDLDINVLTFPGLPVPIELCMTMADGWMYHALSPQSLIAAVKQGRSGRNSLVDNPHFKEMGGSGIEGAFQIEFIDTPRVMVDGYGLVSLGMAALSNATRSPTDEQRDAGPIMPSYSDLAAGAKAYLHIARMVGDDMVVTGQSDRSLLVNACGTIGVMGGSTGAIAIGAMMAGIMLPALGKARESATHVKSMSQLRSICASMMVYAADHEDKMPPSMDELVRGNFIMPEMLASPVGPVSDGKGDYWFNFGIGRMSTVQRPDRTILGYDRAMYEQGGNVAVVFFDGHIEQVPTWQFDQLIQEEPNAGTDFKLPGAP